MFLYAGAAILVGAGNRLRKAWIDTGVIPIDGVPARAMGGSTSPRSPQNSSWPGCWRGAARRRSVGGARIVESEPVDAAHRLPRDRVRPSSGSINPLPTDTRQAEEVLLTAAQSLLAVILLINLRITLWEAGVLLVLFLAQFPTPHSINVPRAPSASVFRVRGGLPRTAVLRDAAIQARARQRPRSITRFHETAPLTEHVAGRMVCAHSRRTRLRGGRLGDVRDSCQSHRPGAHDGRSAAALDNARTTLSLLGAELQQLITRDGHLRLRATPMRPTTRR